MKNAIDIATKVWWAHKWRLVHGILWAFSAEYGTRFRSMPYRCCQFVVPPPAKWVSVIDATQYVGMYLFCRSE